MNKLTKTLYIITIVFFFFQAFSQSLTGNGFENNSILYLFSFITVISTGLMIEFIKKDFSVDYLKKHYKSPIRLTLIVIGIVVLVWLWQKEKIVTPYILGLLIYFIVSFIYVIESRIAALFSMILLGYSAVLLILGNRPLAETFAIYVFYLLAIIVVLQIREYCLSPNCHSELDSESQQAVKRDSGSSPE